MVDLFSLTNNASSIKVQHKPLKLSQAAKALPHLCNGDRRVYCETSWPMVADAAGDDLLRPKTSKNHQDCSDLLRLAMKNPFEQGYAKPIALKFCVFACRHHAMADIPKMPTEHVFAG